MNGRWVPSSPAPQNMNPLNNFGAPTQFQPIIFPNSNFLHAPPPLNQTHQVNIVYSNRPQAWNMNYLFQKQELMTYITKFNDKSHYFCSICTDLLWEPYQCAKCHKIACLQCIALKIQTLQCCPWCEEKVDIRKCEASIYKNLQNLRFYCQYNFQGCQEKLNFDNMVKHKDLCEYEQVQCVYSGCSYEKQRKDFKDHHETCQFRDTFCKWCSMKLKAHFQEEHEDICDRKVVECLNQGCGLKIIRIDLPVHSQQCHFALINCYYCKREVLISEITQHEEDCDERNQECSGCDIELQRKFMRQHVKTCKQVTIQCNQCLGDIQRKDMGLNHTEIVCLQVGMQILQEAKVQQDLLIKHLIEETSFLKRELEISRSQISKLQQVQFPMPVPIQRLFMHPN